MLWGVIILLAGGLVGFIIYNKTLTADIKILNDELTRINKKLYEAERKIDMIENSELHNLRYWRWTIEEKLIRANIIKIEAGVIK